MKPVSSIANLVLKKSQIDALQEVENVHQFNPNAVRMTKSLGDLTGLSKVGLHLVRVEPGRETTQHHNHEESDEFVYIVSGCIELSYGDEVILLEAGDFVGFPLKGPSHSMKNVSDQDVVYLMGGSRPDIDICNYPKIERRMYLLREQREYVDTKDLAYLVKK